MSNILWFKSQQKVYDKYLYASGDLTLPAISRPTYYISVISNTTWTIKVTSNITDPGSWIHLSKTSGSYNDVVTFTIDDNDSIEERIAYITFTGVGADSSIYTVKQLSSDEQPYLNLSTGDFSVPATSNTTTFNIISNVSWILRVSDQTSSSWILFKKGTTRDVQSGYNDVIAGSGNATISVTSSENVMAASRYVKMQLIGDNYTNLYRYFNITQVGSVLYFPTGSTSLTFGPTAGLSQTINLQTNYPLVTASQSAQANWNYSTTVNVSAVDYDSSLGKVIKPITISTKAANNDWYAKSSMIDYSIPGRSPYKVNLTQTPQPKLEFSNVSTGDVTWAGIPNDLVTDKRVFAVKSTHEYTITISNPSMVQLEGNPSASIIYPPNGAGLPRNFYYTVTTNTDKVNGRSCTITAKQNETGLTKTITVTQRKMSTLTITGPIYLYDSPSGYLRRNNPASPTSPEVFDLKVDTDEYTPWIISNPNWMLPDVTQGVGATTTFLRVSPNTSGDSRRGIINIRSKESSLLNASYTLEQAYFYYEFDKPTNQTENWVKSRLYVDYNEHRGSNAEGFEVGTNFGSKAGFNVTTRFDSPDNNWIFLYSTTTSRIWFNINSNSGSESRNAVVYGTATCTENDALGHPIKAEATGFVVQSKNGDQPQPNPFITITPMPDTIQYMHEGNPLVYDVPKGMVTYLNFDYVMSWGGRASATISPYDPNNIVGSESYMFTNNNSRQGMNADGIAQDAGYNGSISTLIYSPSTYPKTGTIRFAVNPTSPTATTRNGSIWINSKVGSGSIILYINQNQ